MSESVVSGKHAVHYERGSGIIYLVHFGTIEAEDAHIIRKAIDDICDLAPPGEPGFLLVDTTNAGGISNDARKVFTSSRLMERETYIAHFGASFGARIFINLMMKALSFSSYKMHVNLVASEAEARAWLLEKKQGLRDRRA